MWQQVFRSRVDYVSDDAVWVCTYKSDAEMGTRRSFFFFQYAEESLRSNSIHKSRYLKTLDSPNSVLKQKEHLKLFQYRRTILWTGDHRQRAARSSELTHCGETITNCARKLLMRDHCISIEFFLCISSRKFQRRVVF